MTKVSDAASPPLNEEQQQRLTIALERYLDCLEQGELPDIDRLCEDFPDLDHVIRDHIPCQAQTGPKTNKKAKEKPKRDILADEDPENEDPPKKLSDYELIEEIGRGGMGVVFKAKQISLDRIVAVKILPNAAIWDCKQIARFQNEAQAAAQLNHPNIVSVHTVGNEDGTYFYSMPLIDGISLEKAVRRIKADPDFTFEHVVPNDTTLCNAPAFDGSRNSYQSSLAKNLFNDPNEDLDSETEGTKAKKRRSTSIHRMIQTPGYVRAIVELVAQAAQALHFAHQHGIIHRDIKPSNLLIDRQGNLWITDFGLAMMLGQSGLTGPGDVMGTFRYMSPEQTSGKSYAIDHRTDIYSLGVTLYELLTLHPVVDAEDRLEMLKQIRVYSPPSPRSRNPAISKTLENILFKAISKYPEERYATAQLFAEDLSRYLSSGRSLAKAPGIVRTVCRVVRRNPQWSVCFTAILLALVATLAPSLAWMSARNLKMSAQIAQSNQQLQSADKALEELVLPQLEQLRLRSGTESHQKQVYQAYSGFLKPFSEYIQTDAAFRSQSGKLMHRLADLSSIANSDRETLAATLEAKEQIVKWVAQGDSLATAADLYLVHHDLANIRFRMGQIEPALLELKALLEPQPQHPANGPSPSSSTHAWLEALIRLDVGFALAHLGYGGPSENELATARNLLQLDPKAPPSSVVSDMRIRRKLVSSLLDNANLEQVSPELAQRLIESAVSIAMQSQTGRNASTLGAHQLAQCFLALGLNAQRLERKEAAAENFGYAASMMENLVKQDPGNFRFHFEYAAANQALGQSQLANSEPAKAKDSLLLSVKSLDTLCRLLPDPTYQAGLASALHDLASIAAQENKPQEARALLERAILEQKGALESAPNHPAFQELLKNYEATLQQLRGNR